MNPLDAENVDYMFQPEPLPVEDRPPLNHRPSCGCGDLTCPGDAPCDVADVGDGAIDAEYNYFRQSVDGSGPFTLRELARLMILKSRIAA